MTFASELVAILRFAGWETAVLAASIVLARALGRRGARPVEEQILAVLGIGIVLESSFAALFSFTGTNSPAAYWIAAMACGAGAVATRYGREALAGAAGGLKTAGIFRYPRMSACFAGLLAPLVFLSFHPVQESDSINYLHYLIDWMANRATPYCFATNYVAFWELSFLPSWTVTGLDLFFPLLALKAVLVLALAAWLAGRELGLRRHLLLWTVFGALLLGHLWGESSGVPTLKNDVLHGAGFVLLTVVVLRAARRRLHTADAALFALGAAFAAVKYTGIFMVALAAGALLWLELGRRKRLLHSAAVFLAAGLFLLLTSGHYYLRNLLLYGNPFYPFQINFAFLHLPGTADLSGTSILYNLGNPNLWRALFFPSGGISSAGVLFPLVLAAALASSVWLVALRPPALRQFAWAGGLLLAGWFLYFRSVYGAGAVPGDLGFIVGLSTLRYVIGVLAVSELLLAALLARRSPRLALGLVLVNAASRAAILYARLPGGNFPVRAVIAASAAVGLAVWLLARYTPPPRRALACVAAAALALVAGGPGIVERNRASWLPWWPDLKPALQAARSSSLAVLVYPEWGYFAGHALAAGNPVDPSVQALAGEDLDRLPAARRPRYLAALLTPGSAETATWRTRHAAEFARWGYAITGDSGLGAILERTLPPVRVPAGATLEAWYAPAGIMAIAGVAEFSGHTLRNGDVAADPSGGLVRLGSGGRQTLEPAPGLVIRLRNCGDLDFTPGFPKGRPSGAVYRREAGRWIAATARPAAQAELPSPSWNASAGGGSYVQEILAEGDGPFVRLRAASDARWLIYSAAYPDGLPDGVPVTVRAVVRCPHGCSLSTAGHTPELDRPVKSDDWTTVSLSFAFQRNGRPQHYAVGLARCQRGDWMDLRSFELRAGCFPYE